MRWKPAYLKRFLCGDRWRHAFSAGHQCGRRPGGVRGGLSKPSRAADQTSQGAPHPAVATADASRSAKTITGGISHDESGNDAVATRAAARARWHRLVAAGAGWWMVLALAWLYCRVGSVARKRRLRTAYRRIALVHSMSSAHGRQDRRLNWLLKAAALKAYPQEQVAGLTGQRGSSFSHRAAPRSRRTPLLNSTASISASPRQSPALFDAAEHWIRQHEVTHA